MPAVLTSGSTTLAPAALSEYRINQESGSIVHPILGRANPDVTLRPASTRTGSFTIDFRTEALSESARAALVGGVVWNLTYPEQSSLNMRFIVRSVGREVAGNGRWPVAVTFHEVTT